MESMRVTSAYYDGRYVWTTDDIFGGIYVIEVPCMNVSCIVSAMEMYQYGVFQAASIIGWEDYIIVVPKQIDYRWIFYEKKAKKISHRKITEIHSHTPEVCVLGNFIYIPPLYKGEPFVVYDLERMRVCAIINNFCTEDVNYEIWRVYEKDGACCIPLRGTNYIYMFSDMKYEKMQVKIREPIGDADYAEDGYWVLPQEGSYLYKINYAGEIVETVKLVIKGEELCANYFVRLISEYNHVFLLPYRNDDLYVYEYRKHEFFKIERHCPGLTNSVAYDIDNIPYWGYLMKNNEICFLPRKNMWISFDLEKNITNSLNIFLPDNVDYVMIKNWILRLRNHDIFVEETKESLFMFLECIGIDNRKKDISDCCDSAIGKKIYNYIKDISIIK